MAVLLLNRLHTAYRPQEVTWLIMNGICRLMPNTMEGKLRPSTASRHEETREHIIPVHTHVVPPEHTSTVAGEPFTELPIVSDINTLTAI